MGFHQGFPAQRQGFFDLLLNWMLLIFRIAIAHDISIPSAMYLRIP